MKFNLNVNTVNISYLKSMQKLKKHKIFTLKLTEKKPEFESIRLNKTPERSEFKANGYTAFPDYAVKGNKVALIHTEVAERVPEQHPLG